jgi:hypothetical protein
MTKTLVMTKPDLDGYRETHDGKYYIIYLAGRCGIYQIGKHTDQGSIHLEDVRGFRNARQRLVEIMQEASK